MPDCLREIRSLLVWTVLTASTIGPGTIAMCSKAGADYKGVLIWCVLIAALIAWVMQEGTARLTIASGRSLGDYIREQTQTSRRLMLARCFFAAFVVVGNFAYECNNFAGTSASEREQCGATPSKRYLPTAELVVRSGFGRAAHHAIYSAQLERHRLQLDWRTLR